MTDTYQNDPAYDITPEEQAAIDKMREETPDQTTDADPQLAPPQPDPQEPPTDSNPDDVTPPADDGDDDESVDEITIDATGKAHDASGKFVPKEAYLRVKGQRKAERDTNKQLQERVIVGETRLSQLIEIINSAPDDGEPGSGKKAGTAEPNPFEEEQIDKVTKPIEAMEQMQRQMAFLAKQNSNLVQQVQNTNNATTAHNTEMQIVDAYRQDAAAFDAKEPAFRHAWAHLSGMWHKQLEAMGVTDKAQRDRTILETERGIVHNAFSKKQSPAKAIMDLSIASGFVKPAGGKPNGDGEQPQVSDAARKINNQNKAMNANKSLSSGGGSSIPENSAILRMADMSDDEFCEFADTVAGKAALRKAGLME